MWNSARISWSRRLTGRSANWTRRPSWPRRSWTMSVGWPSMRWSDPNSQVTSFLYKIVLYCPAVFGHFFDPPGNHPRGLIFPTVNQINQSSVDFPCNPSVDWLIDDKLTLTWLVYWIRTARSVFTGAGLKWPNIAGQYSTWSNTRVRCMRFLFASVFTSRYEIINSQRKKAHLNRFIIFFAGNIEVNFDAAAGKTVTESHVVTQQTDISHPRM